MTFFFLLKLERKILFLFSFVHAKRVNVQKYESKLCVLQKKESWTAIGHVNEDRILGSKVINVSSNKQYKFIYIHTIQIFWGL